MILNLLQQYFWGLVLPYIITPFYMIAAPVALYFFIRPPRGPAYSTCGECHYPVQGLSALKCPECGSDLREVGIESPGRTRPLPKWLRLSIWSLALPPVAWAGSFLFLTYVGPWVVESTRSWSIGPADSGSFNAIDMYAQGDRLRAGLLFHRFWSYDDSPMEELTLSFNDRTEQATEPHDLILDLEAAAMQQEQTVGSEQKAQILKWITSEGVSLEGVDANQLADHLVQVVEIAFLSPSPPMDLSNSSIESRPSVSGRNVIHPDWSIWTMISVWVIVFVAGCIRIARR